MWMDEQNTDRVGDRRARQLLDAVGQPSGHGQGKAIVSAGPFCMTMLTDGIKSHGAEDSVEQLDIAEILDRACVDDAPIDTKSGSSA